MTEKCEHGSPPSHCPSCYRTRIQTEAAVRREAVELATQEALVHEAGRVCLTCGTSMTGRRPQAIYCKSGCRVRAHRHR